MLRPSAICGAPESVPSRILAGRRRWATVGRRLSLSLLWSLVLAWGCGVLGSFPSSLEVHLVNDSNQILVLEGTARLPDSAPVSAEIRDADRSLAHASSLVSRGRFFMTLDIALIPGNKPLLLEVVFDPQQASDQVLAEVGPDGRWMVGEQVHEEEDGSYRLVQAVQVVLPMSRRDAAIRQVQAGDLAAGIAGLEPVVAQEQEDLEARAWLALARLQKDPGERTPGSTSHQDLSAAARTQSLPGLLHSQVSSWLARLDREAAILANKQAWERERRRLQEQREQERWRVRPGRSLAGVELGLEGHVLFAAHPPASLPAPVDGLRRVRLPDLDLEVDLDTQIQRVVRIRTTSERFLLPGQLGVGAPLLAFREHHPDMVAVLGPIERGRDGQRIARGEAWLPEGLILEYERTFAGSGLAVDVVIGMVVVPPGQPPPSVLQTTP
ncbi:MAG: hypothetical protein GX934_00765 [Burkholderiales bacterium]|jgi:hypothetical protein|nr:hypothetical protein [Burkholderiales bacterium]